MAVKTIELDGIGKVNIYKRRGSSSIRLSFDSSGAVKVTQPVWLPYEAGIKFAKDKYDWIIKHQPEPIRDFANNERIGKAHRIVLIPSAQVKGVSGRIIGTNVQVKYPQHLSANDPLVQKKIELTAKKALLQEASQLLPQKLAELARAHHFTYKSVTIKQLRSKWGSCDQHQRITLNYYLMQLPWNLIEYVLLHELVHTEHLNHGSDFWERFEQVLPNAKKVRKELKTYKTTVVQSA